MTITAVKTIPFQQAMKVFTKYVSKSESSPVLKTVYFGEDGYFYATNAEHLLRVNSDYVSDIPSDFTKGMQFDPKQMKIVNEGRFPECSRLIPQDSKSTVVFGNYNLKDFTEQVKLAKKLIPKKYGHIQLNFTQKDLTITAFERKEEDKKAWFSQVNEVTLGNIHVNGEELKIKLNEKYLLTALETVKKLWKLENLRHVEMRMIGHTRPILFTQHGVFDVIVMPIRMY